MKMGVLSNLDGSDWIAKLVCEQAAFIAAKKAESEKVAPGLYRKAEFYYLKAKSSYKRKYFNKAKQYSVLSKKFSEKAEYISIRKKAIENLE